MEKKNMEKIKNIFFGLYKGETDLTLTYWVGFVLVVFLFNTVSAFYVNSLPYPFSFYEIYIIRLLNFSLIAYSIFMFIVLWRCTNKHKGSKIWLNIVRLVVLYNIYALCNTYYPILRSFVDIDYKLKLNIEYTNSQTPYKIDEEITLVEASLTDKEVTYIYKLVNETRTNIMSTNLNIFKDRLKNNICNDADVSSAINNDYIFTYRYSNKYGKKFTHILIDKDACDQLENDNNILKKVLEGK